jgi:hypothetical protein
MPSGAPARFVTFTLAALMLLAACGGPPPAEEPAPATGEAAPAPAERIDAAGLRVSLNNALREHVFLVARATGAALSGNTAGFEAAETAIQGNTEDLANLIGSLYGQGTQASFRKLWASHIDMVVDYTQGIAADDQAKADEAAERLTDYSQTLANTFQQMTEGKLPASASQPLILAYITALKTVIDNQKAGNLTAAYTNLRAAVQRSDTIAKPLASAIAMQKGIPGAIGSQATDLRVDLNSRLQEHVFLTSAATGNALDGNTAAFDAAAAAIGANTRDLSNIFGSIYDADTGQSFRELWASHIGMFVDYTQGIATGNQAEADNAVARLTAFVNTLAATLERITTLPASVSGPLIQEHVLSMQGVIDAQKAKNFPSAFGQLRTAAAHMRRIADPLAAAIATQKNLT